ncbi:MAG: esterase-like activity of phytase family protein [Vicinamibacterales bacterium]
MCPESPSCPPAERSWRRSALPRVAKSLFIDLLDASYRVSATQTLKDVIAEKIEGLAWGPNLPDGRHVLFVMSDNDLYLGRPTQVFAFAVDSSAAGANFNYVPQQIDGPLYPPGQARKTAK